MKFNIWVVWTSSNLYEREGVNFIILGAANQYFSTKFWW